MEAGWIVAGLVDVHRGSAGVSRNGLNVFSCSGSSNSNVTIRVVRTHKHDALRFSGRVIGCARVVLIARVLG